MDLRTLFDLESHGPDTYVGIGPKYPWGGLYGGQIVAQALRAAAATVVAERRPAPHSLRAYFIRRGDHTEPVRYEVDRIRNGRSFSTRRVVARQAIGAILNLEASFQRAEPSEDVAAGLVPHGLPAPDDARTRLVDPSFERRMVPPSALAGGERTGAAGSQRGCKVTVPLGDDELVHRCWLAYLSDDFPFDAVRVARRPPRPRRGEREPRPHHLVPSPRPCRPVAAPRLQLSRLRRRAWPRDRPRVHGRRHARRDGRPGGARTRIAAPEAGAELPCDGERCPAAARSGAARAARSRAAPQRPARRLHVEVGRDEHVVPRHEADRVPARRGRADGGRRARADPRRRDRDRRADGRRRPGGLRARRHRRDTRSPLASFTVRKEAKDHGVTGRIAGALCPAIAW